MYTCRLIGRLDLSCVSFGQSVKPGEVAFCSSISISPRFCRANQRESAAVAERGQSAGFGDKMRLLETVEVSIRLALTSVWY